MGWVGKLPCPIQHPSKGKAPPGHTTIAHMSVEVPQLDNGVQIRGSFQQRRESNLSEGLGFRSLYVKVKPAISNRYHSTSSTRSSSFPAREVMFHVPTTSFRSHGLDLQDPALVCCSIHNTLLIPLVGGGTTGRRAHVSGSCWAQPEPMSKAHAHRSLLQA